MIVYFWGFFLVIFFPHFYRLILNVNVLLIISHTCVISNTFINKALNFFIIIIIFFFCKNPNQTFNNVFIVCKCIFTKFESPN